MVNVQYVIRPNNRKIGPRTLRSNNKYIFKTNTKSVLNINEVHSTKVQFSGMSYRKMYNLRIMCMNLKKLVKRMYRNYENLL